MSKSLKYMADGADFDFPSGFGFSRSGNYAKGGAACAPGGKTPRFDVGGAVDRTTVMPGARQPAASSDYADEGDRRGRTFYPDEGARRGTPAAKAAPAKPASPKPAAKAPMRAQAKAPEGALSSALAAMPSPRRDDPDRPQMQSPPVSRPAREDDVRSQRGVTTKTRQPVEITTGGGNYTDVDDYAKGGSTRAKMAALKPGIRGSTKGNMARKSAAGGVPSIPLPAAAAAARGAAMLGRASAKAPGMAPGMPTGGAPIPGPGPMAGGPPMPGGDDAPPMMARGGHMSKAARNQGIAKVMRKAAGGSVATGDGLGDTTDMPPRPMSQDEEQEYAGWMGRYGDNPSNRKYLNDHIGRMGLRAPPAPPEQAPSASGHGQMMMRERFVRMVPDDNSKNATDPADKFFRPKDGKIGRQSDRNFAKGGHLTTAARNRMPASDFALPGNGAGPSGKGSGSYPIPDASHARNALSRVAQHGSSGQKAAVKAAVHSRFPGIGKAKGGHAKHDDAKQDRALIKKMLAEHERGEGEGEGKGYAMGGRAMLPRGMKPTAMQRHSIIGEVGAAPVRSRGQGIVPRTPMPYGVAGSDERPPAKKAPTTGR